jgi:hypothetical protein
MIHEGKEAILRKEVQTDRSIPNLIKTINWTL